MRWVEGSCSVTSAVSRRGREPLDVGVEEAGGGEGGAAVAGALAEGWLDGLE